MNVLLLTPDFLPVWGGVGTYVYELAKNMGNDVQLHIVTPKRDRFSLQVINNNSLNLDVFPNNVHIHFLGSASDNFIYNIKFQLICWMQLSKIVKDYDIDIIHSQSGMPDLLLSPQKLGVPIVTTIHTTIENQANVLRNSKIKFNQLEYSEKMTLIFSYLGNFLENRYYNSDRYFITVSNWAKMLISNDKKIPTEKIAVIHNGVDTTQFSPVHKVNSYKYFDDLSNITATKVLYLSRLIESKGLNFFLNSMSSILNKTDVHFIIAGAGKIPNIAIPKKNYTHLGYVPHELSNYLYSLSDIYILPSLSENFPMSLLEAMASGCAVIATNVGGVPEMVTHGVDGLIIPPKSTDHIIESIIYLSKNKSIRNDLGIAARKKVMNNFGWSTSVDKTIIYYNEVLKKLNKI